MSIVSGTVGAITSSSAANKASAAQKASADRTAALAESQWQRYLDTFAPYEDKLLVEAAMPARETAGFKNAMGGVNRGYADMGANTRRLMGGQYQWGGGTSENRMNTLERMRVKDQAGLESTWDANRFNRMYALSAMGRNLPSQALTGMGLAGTGYGNQATMYGNLAGQSARGAGQGAAQAGKMIYDWWNTPSPGASAPSGGYTPYGGEFTLDTPGVESFTM